LVDMKQILIVEDDLALGKGIQLAVKSVDISND
jgi:peptidyl-tRNA hydrolase